MELESAKRASFGQVLMRAARLWNELALERLHERAAYRDIRASHLGLMPHLDFVGVRPGELANRLGVSKQAVGPLLDELEMMGFVEKVVDPRDARARLVRLRAEAREAIAEGLRVLAEVGEEVEQQASAGLLDALLPGMQRVLGALETLSSEGR